MIQQDLQVKWYDLSGYTICIKCNQGQWLDRFSRFLNIPEGRAGAPHLSLDLQVVEAEKVDRLMPLPEAGLKIPDFTLLLNRPIAMHTYQGESEQWSDYEGYARTNVDYAHGTATVLLLRNNDIKPLYTDMLFTYNLINQLMGKYDYFAVHASCVQFNGAGIILSGNSGRGKSTAVFALLQHGFKVLSDERILLYSADEGYRGCSISDVIKVREAARQLFFPALVPEQAYDSIDDEHYYKCDIITPGKWLADSGINYFLVINQSGTPQSRLIKINPIRAVGEFFPVTMKAYDFKEAATKKFNFLMDFLSSVPCYQLDFGTDMSRFAALLQSLTEGRP